MSQHSALSAVSRTSFNASRLFGLPTDILRNLLAQLRSLGQPTAERDDELIIAFAGFGARLAGMLGLPRPVPLERFEAGQPVVAGDVLVGAGGTPELLPALLAESEAVAAAYDSALAAAIPPGVTFVVPFVMTPPPAAAPAYQAAAAAPLGASGTTASGVHRATSSRFRCPPARSEARPRRRAS
mgnify:CR=1 FL=1